MKKLYAILFFSLLILQSFAQQYTVTGKVSRESDNKGIKGAHVYIKNNDATEILTDANIGDILTFSRFGYHPVEIEVTGDRHDILLIPDEKKYEPDDLEEIIVEMNKHIDLIRRESSNHYGRPLPCPECPPIEKKLRNTL